MWDRVHAYGFSALVLGAILWPLTQPASYDSFPLSTYPMFARAKPARATISHALAIDTQGAQRVIPPAVVTGGEVMQARVTLRRAAPHHRRRLA